MNSRLVLIQHRNKRAWIYPELGFQLHRFEQDFGKGKTTSVIYTPDLPLEPSDRRYGNPVLFPNPGVCPGPNGPDSWVWNEKNLVMPSHGIARNCYWQVCDIQPDRITGVLVPQTVTKLVYPFDFRLQLTYRLDESGLVLDAEVQNTGKEAFPYALGFHPYIRAPLGSQGTVGKCAVNLPAGTHFQTRDEWVSHEKGPFAACRIKADMEMVQSIILVDTQRFLELEDETNQWIARVSVEKSPMDFPVWVVWSASPESPFVCLEPWTSLPNALNSPDTRRCPPGQTHRYQMILSVRAKDNPGAA